MPANLIDNNQFPISSLNSPIGYSKNPLLYDQRREGSNTPNSSDANKSKDQSPPLQLLTPPQSSNGLTFDKLPFEIRLKVANELSQFDCIKLLRVSKIIYSSTVPRLYQYIIIDEDFNIFNNEKEYGFKHFEPKEDLGGEGRHRKEFSCTYINSSYNFKRFLKEYNNKIEKESHEDDHGLFPHIKRFECINIPDSMNIYDHDLNNRLVQFFRNLKHLRQLIWLSDNFRLELLYSLPQKHLINSLQLNIKFTNYLNELNTDDELDDLSIASFPNLVNFQIQPFQNSRKLIKIINNLLVNKNDPVEVSSNLRSLVLTRFQKISDSSILLPNCRDLVSIRSERIPNTNGVRSTIHTSLHDVDLNALPSLFRDSKLKYLSNLSVLSIDNILVGPQDAELLIESVNLPLLQRLFLRGVSEYQMLEEDVITVDSNRQQLIALLKPSFILEIAPYLSGLKQLSIDYREALVDTVPQFLENLASNSLESLEVVIRLNKTKPLRTREEEREYYGQYANAIVHFKNSLTKLALEIRIEVDNYQDSNNINVLESIPFNIGFYSKLLELKHLTGFRLNPGSNANEVLQLISRLSNLHNVDIFGSRAGGCPNLGLGMMHPNVYDEWFKVQHVALFYLQSNPNIRYIRINDCIFECEGSGLRVNPRYGITRWFEDLVKPTYSL
ncbi:uncharacterized protein RJT20DRAFT_47946 [Scheffersomyces xylosifermentans]|uniref:uncharacterized protein n=1 Tax=Scheffersomyces xylosifermentans TaxID=1304137 RepID=UPI00315D8690